MFKSKYKSSPLYRFEGNIVFIHFNYFLISLYYYLSHVEFLVYSPLRERTSRSVQFDTLPLWIRCIYTWSKTKTVASLLFKVLMWQYIIEDYRTSSCLSIH